MDQPPGSGSQARNDTLHVPPSGARLEVQWRGSEEFLESGFDNDSAPSILANGNSSDGKIIGPETQMDAELRPSSVIVMADSSNHGGNNFYSLSSANPPVAADIPPVAGPSSREDPLAVRVGRKVAAYFARWQGGHDTRLPIPEPLDMLLAFVGAFLAILLVVGLDRALSGAAHLPVLVASFGASAVLIFGAVESKLAQPRNFIGGQFISAVIGCSVRAAFGVGSNLTWLSAPLGMALSLTAMQITATVHPPGGATALIAASAENERPWAGFQFVLTVLIGSLAMQLVALFVNNLHQKRPYPRYWWG